MGDVIHKLCMTTDLETKQRQSLVICGLDALHFATLLRGTPYEDAPVSGDGDDENGEEFTLCIEEAEYVVEALQTWIAARKAWIEANPDSMAQTIKGYSAEIMDYSERFIQPDDLLARAEGKTP